MGEALSKAQALEKQYKWLEARDQYQQALSIVDENDFLKKGELQEKIGYCILRAACQAESHDEFRSLMAHAVEAYREAIQLYEGAPDSKKSLARDLHCGSVISYVDFWFAGDRDSKRVPLEECCRLEREALRIYGEAGDQAGIGETCVTLSSYLSNLLDLTVELRERASIMEEALSLGERAIKTFTETGDEQGLAEAYLITGMNSYDGAMSMDTEAKTLECSRKASGYMKEAVKYSEKIGDRFLQGRSHVFLGFVEHDLGFGREAASETFKKGLQFSLETKDRCLISEAYDGMRYNTGALADSAVDPDRAKALMEQARAYGQDAIKCSTLVDYDRGIPHSYNVEAHYYKSLALQAQTDARRELLLKAVASEKQSLQHVEKAGYSHATYHLLASHVVTVWRLSAVESGADRANTLEEAISVDEKGIYYTGQLRPYFMYVRGGVFTYLGGMLLEFSTLQETPEKKIEVLHRSISNIETGLALIQRHISTHPPRRELFEAQGGAQARLGTALEELYKLTHERQILTRATQSYQDAVQSFGRADRPSRAAEAEWQTALTYERLGEYSESASSFESASNRYEQAAESVPQVRNLYADYAKYMQAWSEIEKARQRHAEKEYGTAKEYYERAAELHESTKRWDYLSSNYMAWTRLEEAEDLSRREHTQEARDLFEQAADLFAEAKESVKKRLDRIDAEREKQLAQELIQASDYRREYCLGRAALEEAKLLDKQGDHVASSRRYGLAAKSFEKVVDAMEDESERREIVSIAHLCQAWEKMTGAEARRSPELYLEASQLFDKAKESAVDEKATTLALGHSSFCRALEAGARYEATHEEAFHTAAKSHVETATNFYLGAGFKDASEYAKATDTLFDSYRYMYRAQLEDDLAKKAQLYQLAEKLLQTSAGFYVTAKHPEKSDQVLRVLESVRQKREITLSLTEVLHAPAVTSTTVSFSTPSQTREQAVGLERFEYADIQANLMPRDQEAKLGDVIRLKIDLVNAGRGGAQLIKAAELLPQGFEVVEKPDMYLVEDHGLNLKGKSLAPLRTEELNLVLKPLDKGTYQIRPRILYLDESGKYKSHEPEPATIVVKELGISGWLKGPTRDK